jgi:HEAT repeat protein
LTDKKKINEVVEKLATGSEKEKEKAMKELSKENSDEHLTYLSEMLSKQKDEKVRESLCEVLGTFENPIATKALIKALEDKQTGVRFKAVVALSQKADEDAVGKLIDRFKKEKDDLVRTEIAKTLGLIGNNKAVNSLLHILRKQNIDRFLKMKIVISLGQIGDKKALKALRNITRRSQDERLVFHALEAIEKIENN